MLKRAIQIHKDVKSKKSIAMHWGTFQLTDEPMDEPIKLLQELTNKLKISKDEFSYMTHGQTRKNLNQIIIKLIRESNYNYY